MRDQFQQVPLLPAALPHVHLDALEPLHRDVEAPHRIVLADPVDDRCQGSEFSDISHSGDSLRDPCQQYLAEVPPSHGW